MQRSVLLILLCGSGTCSTVAAFNRPSLPAPSGQYAVGRVSYSFIDPERTEPLSETSGARRSMMVYVWYPAERNLPGFDAIESRLKKGEVAGMFRPAKYSGQDSLPATRLVDDAPVVSGRHKFPLLIFTHGWGNTTFLYTAELQDIVSHDTSLFPWIIRMTPCTRSS